jgi:hypothetical protein
MKGEWGRNVRSKRCFRPSSTRIVKEQVANRLEEQLVDGWEQPKEEEEDLGITDSHELKVLPDNEDEEKEEILLAHTKTKRSKKQPETKTSQQKNEKEEQQYS